MNELQFAESALPPQTICLGLSLKAYCLRHEIVLLRYQSPFLCLSRAEFDALPMPKQVFALAFAVQICAVKPPKWKKIWQFRTRNADYALEIAEFRNYLAAGRRMMPVMSSSDESDKEAYEIGNKGEKLEGGRCLGSPMIGSMILFGINHMKVDQDAVLDAPYGYLANLYLTYLESKGAVAIENQSELDARREMIRQREELRAEKVEAQALWDECKTDLERQAAFEKCPRIGNLFAEEWNNAKTDDEKATIEQKWPLIAEAVLSQANLKGITVCQQV